MAQLEREPPAKTDDFSSILETRVVEVNQLPQAILTCTLGPIKVKSITPLHPPTQIKKKLKLKKK